ncbi:MAG: amidohydrolase family protein [Candidatus Sungbacteria bacterium]|uniref:Amidohydrolase family protein n=1 Tax=Candidatus Sungiibacteriota bacterium TaxID=2750080 RepID=A0A932QYG4_9BACT|nr:amidohydrolase family protein [Candidatus Sungbacteria bacterium]
MAYDIVIKGGSVIDGTGSPMTIADIGIKGDKIADIGVLSSGSAKTEILAVGKYVTPGFVDITNHSDTHLTIFAYPALESMLMQGITTIIGGNCGSSLAPLFSREAILGISKWANIGDININWTSVGEFLDTLAGLRPGVNFGMLVGYGTLQRGVLGDEARGVRPDEREHMKLFLGNALDQGVFGLSLGLAYGHERIASTDEIIETARVLAGRGIIKIHLRSEGKGTLGAVNEAVRISREAGAPVIISHFKVIGKKAWPLAPKALEFMEHARSTGADITCDVSPYRTTGSPLYLLLPSWTRVGGFKNLFRRIDHPGDRRKIIEDLRLHTLHYDTITVLSANQPSLAGKTIAEIAEHTGLSPEEAMLEILRANEGRISIIGRTVRGKNTDMALGRPDTLVASDGIGMSQDAVKSGNLTHPRSFGAFPHFWHRFVIDRPLLGPEAAIAKMTTAPARKIGIEDRGALWPGQAADIVIFDPKLLRDRATYQDPFRYAAGIEWVVVNGQIAVSQGQYTGSRAGKILRKKRA